MNTSKRITSTLSRTINHWKRRRSGSPPSNKNFMSADDRWNPQSRPWRTGINCWHSKNEPFSVVWTETSITSWNKAAEQFTFPLCLMFLYFCESGNFDTISLAIVSYLAYTIHAITNCISNERMHSSFSSATPILRGWSTQAKLRRFFLPWREKTEVKKHCRISL